MIGRSMRRALGISASLLTLWAATIVVQPTSSFAAEETTPAISAEEKALREMRFIQVLARDKYERTKAANFGMSIEAIRTDSVWGFANRRAIQKMEEAGMEVLGDHDFEVARGGHQNMFGFPPADDAFHTYDETLAMLRDLASKNADIARVHSIGKTIENRDIWAIHINTSQDSIERGRSSKPGIVFMGNHHAREHLSAEIPLLLTQHLLNNRGDAQIANLLETRDIWIIPMVNPDGVEYDISSTRYKMWRKNRKNNGDGTYGVDLNRNYGYQWGTGGSDKDTSSEVYMGKAPFSEPETQAIKAFVDSQPNLKILLSFHTFSELVLYPWGHTYDPVANQRDRTTYETMARTMASWNKYTPQQSSDLYIASGDTTDWSYGVHGIFSFTFELSPKSMWEGGFYPGAKVIDKVFQANLRPCLYLIDLADNPHRATETSQPAGWLKNYVEPRIPEQLMWQTHPVSFAH